MLALPGENRQTLAASLLRGLDGRSGIGPVGTEPRLYLLCLDAEAIDQVLAFDRPGRGILEIHLHGSLALLAALENQFEVRSRVPDAAEALLQGALGQGQLQLALEQTRLPFAEFLAELESLPSAARMAQAGAAHERSRRALLQVEALPLVLCGATNAGKSTLMNRLLYAERSLTGPQPSLTRDPVRELTCLSGYPYLLVDTAGEGPAESEIDRRAQEMARKERAGSALRLLVVDGAKGPGAPSAEILEGPCLAIRNKADLVQAPWPEQFGPYLQISAQQQSPGELREVIGVALRDLRGLPPAGPVGGAAALDRRQLAQLEALL